MSTLSHLKLISIFLCYGSVYQFIYRCCQYSIGEHFGTLLHLFSYDFVETLPIKFVIVRHCETYSILDYVCVWK